jgi:taurine dioxygenase
VRVEGLKLGALDAAIFAAVKQAFLDHCMLVFPGQYLQPGNPMAFAKMWG